MTDQYADEKRLSVVRYIRLWTFQNDAVQHWIFNHESSDNFVYVSHTHTQITLHIQNKADMSPVALLWNYSLVNISKPEEFKQKRSDDFSWPIPLTFHPGKESRHTSQHLIMKQKVETKEIKLYVLVINLETNKMMYDRLLQLLLNLTGHLFYEKLINQLFKSLTSKTNKNIFKWHNLAVDNKTKMLSSAASQTRYLFRHIITVFIITQCWSWTIFITSIILSIVPYPWMHTYQKLWIS